MTLAVVFRQRAADDLGALYDWIAADSPEHAIAFVRRIRRRCRDLGDFSGVGRARDDLRPGLRPVAFERRIVIAYAVTVARVEIVRVLRRGRDVDALLGEADPGP